MAGSEAIDAIDRAILRLLARDATLALADIAREVGLTTTPCWKRIRRMEQAGVITGRVAQIDQARVGLPVSVFVGVEAADHSTAWLEQFAAIIAAMPEVVQAWRMSGDVDYLLHVVVPDISGYDIFYRRLIDAVALRNVSSRFVIEQIKSTALPL